MLNRLTRLGLRRVAIIVFLALDALRTNFLFGQEHLLLAFLLTLAMFFYLRGSTATAGAALACGAALNGPECLSIVQLVGQALEKRADTELAKIGQ